MRLLLTLLVASAALLVSAATAGACSCVGGDPRDRLSQARAAFVGTVTEASVTGEGRRTFRMTVERTFKGRLPERIAVSSDGRSSCGIDLDVGQRVGLLLRQTETPYEVGSCDLIEPEELEAATRPYPSGSGAGTARLLVAGRFHDAGLAALDGRGRLIGWAFGSEGDALDVCPGARYALQAGEDVLLIRLRDLAVVGRRKLPDEATSAVRCLSRSGDRLAALTFDYGERSDRRRLVALRDGRIRSLGVRPSVAVALGTRAAYLGDDMSGSYRIVEVDHRSRRTRTLVSRGGSVVALALAPDEKRLAFVSAPSRRRYRLGLVSTTTGDIRTRVLGRSQAPLWLSNRRLAVPHHRRAGDSFDARLRRRGAVASWSTDVAVAVGRRVWWLEFTAGLHGRVLRDPRSPRVTVSYLSGGRGLAAIAGGARVVAGHRVPGASTPATVAVMKPCGRRSRQ